MSEPVELNCDDCGKHLGWYFSGQPRGCVLCDECKDKDAFSETPVGGTAP